MMLSQEHIRVLNDNRRPATFNCQGAVALLASVILQKKGADWNSTSSKLEVADFPSFAVLAADELVSFLDVCEFESARFPLQRRFLKATRHTAEQNRFGERACVIEVGRSFPIPANRINKLVPMICSFDFRHFEICKVLLGQQDRPRNVREHHDALFTEEDRALVGNLSPGQRDNFSRRTLVTIIPG